MSGVSEISEDLVQRPILGQEQACCDASSRFVGMLNGHNSLEDRAMVDVGQVREFERVMRKHGGVKHHIVILDAGHVKRCVIAARLDADIAFPPADHPEILSGSRHPISA
jgi:hypothetical protein